MKTKIVVLFAVILCAYAAENKEEKIEDDMQLKDKRGAEEATADGVNRMPRKQEQAAPVEEPQEDDKSAGKADLEQYRPGQVYSLNAQELLELQPERKAPIANGQQLQQLYADPQPEQKQNLQPFYYLDPQLSSQVSLQPSHAVIARPHYSSNGGEASVGAALSVSDTGSTPSHNFDQDVLALFGHAARQEELRPQLYAQTQQPLQVVPLQQYPQIERYVTKPNKKSSKLRPKVQFSSIPASAAPQQYLIETTNVQAQQQLQNQFHSLQPQRAAQTLRYIPIPVPQSAGQESFYERPESQGLKIVPAPNLQHLQTQAQNNFVYIPQYQQPELTQKQYNKINFIDTERQTIQAVRTEQPRTANVERPLTYLKRFPEPEKARTVKFYNPISLEGLSSAPQPLQIPGEQFYLRPLYRSNEQRGRFEFPPLTLRPSEHARLLEATKAPLSTIFVNKNLSPKKSSRPALRLEPSVKLESASSEQVSADEQRRHLPPPKNNQAYTPNEFAALVAAGYSVTPIPVGNLGQQAAQSRSSVETIQIPQRHPSYNNRHQYLPLRSDEAP